MPGYYGVDVPKDSARAFAKALYRAIYEIETDRLSEPLRELVREARVGLLCDIADMAFMGGFHVD